MGDTRKVTINLPAAQLEDIQHMAEERGVTMTDVIRGAIAVQRFLWERRECILVLQDGDMHREVVFVWA